MRTCFRKMLNLTPPPLNFGLNTQFTPKFGDKFALISVDFSQIPYEVFTNKGLVFFLRVAHVYSIVHTAVLGRRSLSYVICVLFTLHAIVRLI